MTELPPKITGPERLDFWDMFERTDLLPSLERDRDDYDSCLLLI